MGPLEWREPKIDGRTEGDPTTEGSKKLNVDVCTTIIALQGEEKPSVTFFNVLKKQVNQNVHRSKNGSLFATICDVTFSGVGEDLMRFLATARGYLRLWRWARTSDHQCKTRDENVFAFGKHSRLYSYTGGRAPANTVPVPSDSKK